MHTKFTSLSSKVGNAFQVFSIFPKSLEWIPDFYIFLYGIWISFQPLEKKAASIQRQLRFIIYNIFSPRAYASLSQSFYFAFTCTISSLHSASSYAARFSSASALSLLASIPKPLRQQLARLQKAGAKLSCYNTSAFLSTVIFSLSSHIYKYNTDGGQKLATR